VNQVKNYNTKQKQSILDLLIENASCHMTAEEILLKLKEKSTPVSKATLYRYLDLLIAAGAVKRYSSGQNKGCFQYVEGNCSDNVYHLLCSKCGKLIHIDNLDLTTINNKIKKDFDFLVDDSKIVFYGKCRECAKQDEEA